MNPKIKLFLIITVPVLFIISWVYILINFLNSGNNNQNNNISADINNIDRTSTGPNTGKNNENNNISDESNQIDNNRESTRNSSSTGNSIKKINVYMPEFFNNRGFIKLKKKVYENENILINFKTFKDINTYYEKINSSIGKGGGIDIFLLDTSKIEKFKEYSYNINFKKNISSMLNYMFYYHINNDDYTYIPYAIDPMISLVSKDIDVDDSLDLKEIKRSLLIRKKEESNRFSVPLLFGVDDIAVNYLTTGKELFPNYFDILYNIIYQSWLSQNYSFIEFIKELGGSGAYGVWDSKKFLKVQRVLKKRNSNCNIYPSICMLSYGFSKIKFGFLSDVNKFESYFNKSNKNLKDFKIYNFISSSNVYPVRGWGFVVNKNSSKIKPSLKFINHYLMEGEKGNPYIWDDVLSPFNKVLSNQKTLAKYKYLFEYESKFELFKSSSDLMQNFINSTRILEVLKGSYGVKPFLNELNWEF